jgi:Protein of unknown function (DUF4242)
MTVCGAKLAELVLSYCEAGTRVATPGRPVRSEGTAGSCSRELQEKAMKKYMIEREIPGVGTLEGAPLREAAAKSNRVLRQIGPEIRWLESFVAADKMFCVYMASDESLVRQHAELSGFPATKITEIGKVIDPDTGKER